MDREKLCKAAEEQANRSTHWPWGDRKDCFISGAYWLMEQPLTERLTEAEKEKIIKRYNDELEMAQYHTKKMKENVHPMSRQIHANVRKGYISRLKLLETIFGKELFNDNPGLIR